jgi:tetratricopeptide (TPR) repeat protein
MTEIVDRAGAKRETNGKMMGSGRHSRTRSGSLSWLLLVCTFLGAGSFGPGLQANENSTPRDYDEAWKWMEESLKHAGIRNVTMEGDLIKGEINNAPFVINLITVTTAKRVTPAQGIGTTTEVDWYEFPKLTESPGHVIWHSTWSNEAGRDAERFQASLIYLARHSLVAMEAKAAAGLETFKPKAAAWRLQPVKPEMPEEAHRHQVLAEHAYQAKDMDKAIAEYAAALAIFPYWPEGQYNLAMLAGEIGGRIGYDIAATHMKAYLELMPDAPDARAAKDSIIVWEDKR